MRRLILATGIVLLAHPAVSQGIDSELSSVTPPSNAAATAFPPEMQDSLLARAYRRSAAQQDSVTAETATAATAMVPMPKPRPRDTRMASLSTSVPLRLVSPVKDETRIGGPLAVVAEPVRSERAVPAMRSSLDGAIARHAQIHGVPESLVHRVVKRESTYNPRAVSKGNYGLMQIRLGTARALGYNGTVEGLLDAETNLTYAVRYLAGAYRTAGGNHDRAVSYYSSGYYYVAKRQAQQARSLRQEASASPLPLR